MSAEINGTKKGLNEIISGFLIPIADCDCSSGEDDKRERENIALKEGYREEANQRYPFNIDPLKCRTRESGYFLMLEMKYMNIPRELQFPALREKIPEVHRFRIEAIWKKVIETRKKWESHVSTLKDLQGIKDEKNIGYNTEETNVAVQSVMQFQNVQKAQHGPDFFSKSSNLSNCEEAERGRFYDLDKDYLIALRLYYEMLIETQSTWKDDPDVKKRKIKLNDNPPVLDPEKYAELRKSLAIRIRYLQAIDIAHQAASIAKAGHHEQSTGRLRKTGNEPYWYHVLNVMGNWMMDVLPFILEENELPSRASFIVAIAGAALHDLGEDTKITIQDLIGDFLTSRADRVDSTFNEVLKSGFLVENEDETESRKDEIIPGKIKKKMLNLLGSTNRNDLRKMLRVLSKNTELANPNYEQLSQSNCFQEFPETYDDELDKFLLRLITLLPEEERPSTLSLKLQDRADNIGTLLDVPAKKGRHEAASPRKNLRATVTRLIAWAMLDQNPNDYPLCLTLPRIIDVTLKVYLEFCDKYGRQDQTIDGKPIVEEIDHRYIEKLKEWKEKIKRREYPADIADFLDEYDRVNAKAA